MNVVLRLVAIAFLAGAVIDGAFDSRGFDPWDYSADLPGGYFTLLRIAVAGAGAYMAWMLYRLLGRPTTNAFVYGAIAILFQPFVKVSFEYETWQWIDLATLLFFAYEFTGSYLMGRAAVKTLRDSSRRNRTH